MKIIELKLDDGVTGEGVTAISLVKSPAIEKNWIAFSDDPSLEAKPNPAYQFKAIDEEKRIVAGPAMIPEKLIYRVDPDGSENFVFFKVETIRQLAERFFIQGKQGSTTLEHEATLNDITVVESWLVESEQFDKSKAYGFDLPIGTWFVTMRINNDEVWKLVKDKDVLGFSVEGVFTRELIKNNKQMKTTKLDDYLEKIKGLFSEEAPKPDAEKFATVDAELTDGTPVVISYPDGDLAPGVAVTHEVEGEALPLPTGEYKLADGQTLIVAEEGIVGEILEAEAPADEEEMEKDGFTPEQTEALVNGIAEVLATFKSQVEASVKEQTEAMAKTIRAEFKKPAAEHKEETPGKKDDTNTAVQGLSKFVKTQKANK